MAFHIDINVAVRRAAVLDRVNFSADIQLRSKRQNAGCNGPALHRHFSGCGRAARPAATADGAVAVSGQFKIAEIFSRSAFQPITCGTVFCTCILHIFCSRLLFSTIPVFCCLVIHRVSFFSPIIHISRFYFALTYFLRNHPHSKFCRFLIVKI